MREKTTEKDSLYSDLESKSTLDLITSINKEDKKVANAVKKIIPEIVAFVDAAFPKLLSGGRLFYIGAGTSGRLGVLDASECPPTFGVSFEKVVGIIAGGDKAIRKAVEFAEDDDEQAWNDLKSFKITSNDVVLGITASGITRYVIGGVLKAKYYGILTGGISCNKNSPLSKFVDHSICPVVGPEFVTGSTRMKAGTAQKLVLNMISTSLMIKLGHVKGNKMIDMQLTNNKLFDRGTKMIQYSLNISHHNAMNLLKKYGSVRLAIENGKKK